MKERENMSLQILKIILPITIQHLMLSLNSLLDNFMVGELGEFYLAATGSSIKFVNVARQIIYGFVAANAILTSQFSVRKDKKGIAQSLTVSILSSLTFSFLFVLVYFFNRSYILSEFTKNVEIQNIAGQYLDIAIFSSVTLSFIISLTYSLRSRGIMNFQYITCSSLLIVNASLNYLLIFGNFGFPKLGIRGAAIATVTSEVIVALIAIAADRILSYDSFGKFEYLTAIDFSFIWKYFSITIPVIVANLLTSISALLVHNIFGKIGIEALGAYGAFTPIEMIVSHLFSGFGNAVLIIVGNELGRKNFDEAYRKALRINIYGLSLSFIVGVILFLTSEDIANNYQISQLSKYNLATAIKMSALFLPIKIFNTISINGTFRSGGDTMLLFWVGFLFNCLFSVGVTRVGYYFFNFGFIETYSVIVLVEIVIAIVFMVRFKSKKWIKNLTN